MAYLYSAMVRIILRNITSAVVSLFIISLLIFFLSKMVPGDPILSLLDVTFEAEYALNFQEEYERKALELNTDKAVFYFSVVPANFPKNLNQTLLKSQRMWERQLLFEGFKYEKIKNFQSTAVILAQQTSKSELKLSIGNELLSGSLSEIQKDIDHFFNLRLSENPELEQLKSQWEAVKKSRKTSILPRFYFHGTDNQYHNWMSGFLTGNLGTSLLDRKGVGAKIKAVMKWTIFLVLFTLVLSYTLGVVIGVFLSFLKKKRIVSAIEKLLFGIYAIPLFWLATLLLVFFTTTEYGSWTNIFPTVGLAPIDMGEPWYVQVNRYGGQLILPVFCLVIHNLAFVVSLTKRNMNRSKKLGHVMTSKSLGFSSKEIIFRDILPHSLLPIITSVSAAIPSALGGSLVIEIIFNIPGMGRLLFNSILNYDWPVVFAITLFIAIITILSYLLAEVLYKAIDPRIKESSGE